MVLAIHSDLSYTNEPNSWSGVRGHHFLSINANFPPNNCAVLNISLIVKSVISSAAKSKLGAIFIISKYAVPLIKTFEEIGHTQSATPKKTHNPTAYGVVNENIHPKATKSMDMYFHWLWDRECQKQLRIYCRPGTKIGRLLDEASVR